MAVELASAYVSLLPSFRGGAARISRELGGPLASASAGIGKKSGSSFGSAFGKAASLGLVALKAGAFAGAAGLGALGLIGIKTAAQLEQAKISFETLLGSGRKADKFLNDLKGFAAKTPFELPGLISSARQLLGVGQSAKTVIPTLTAWGDASGALGLSQFQFDRAMLAVTQSMAKGKIQAEELMQITEAGIPIWQILSDALGKPIPEIQKLSSEGKLLAEDVWPKVEKQLNKDFGGSMAKQSKTLAGLWSTFMDTLKLGAADAIAPLIPMIKDAMPGAMRILGQALQFGGKALAGFIKAIQGISGFIGNVVASFRSAGGEGSKLASSFSGIVAAFAPLVPVVKEFAQKAIAILVPGLKQVWSVIQTQLLPALQRFLPVVMPIVAFLLRFVGQALLGALKGALQFIKGFFQAIAGLLDIFTGLFTGDWSRLWKGVKTLASGIWNALLGLFKISFNIGMLKLLRIGLTAIRFLWRAGWNAVKALASAAWSAIKSAVRAGISAVVGFFKALPGQARSALSALPGLLFRLGVNALRGLLRGLQNAWRGLWSWLRGLRSTIPGAIGNAAKLLYDVGRAIIQGLWEGIQSMFGTIKSGLQGLAGKIIGWKGPKAYDLKLLVPAGQWIIQGFAKGLESQYGTVKDSLAGLVGDISGPGAPGLSLSGAKISRDGTVNVINAHITIDGARDPVATAKQVHKELLKLKRDLGGASLGLA